MTRRGPEIAAAIKKVMDRKRQEYRDRHGIVGQPTPQQVFGECQAMAILDKVFWAEIAAVLEKKRGRKPIG